MTDDESYIEVETAAGRVRGRWRDIPAESGHAAARSAAFLGIPFAQAPVGDLRFAAPAPVPAWEGVRDALDYGATAQRVDPGVTLIPEPCIAGESTLNVNVFTPRPVLASDPAVDGLPVLVWIHGGGFVAGSPASPWYDGRAFNRDGVVTVSLSYRIGVEGFGLIDGAPANRAVLDWLAGLEWVQQNIARFGGDPARVTIAGQSAGGGAVLTLLGMPRAQHLFRQVWALSGVVGDIPAERARALTQSIAEQAGVSADLSGFAELTPEQLDEAQKKGLEVTSAGASDILARGLPLGPVIDGELLERPTLESLRRGVGADKPLVIGTTDDEFTMALTGQAQKLRWVPRSLLLGRMGLAGAARRAYLAANADVVAAGKARIAGRLVTDRVFRAPLVHFARARGASPTWAYRFSWPSGSFGFAEHCLDVPFFFDCLDGPGMAHTAGDNPPQSIADTLHADAVHFITRGEATWEGWQGDETARVYDAPHVRDESHAYAAVDALL